ncbi:MAG TPA: hypothetical protein VGH97_11565 [Thermoanaerobaculia bacterium]|jgi:hypothetical protein
MSFLDRLNEFSRQMAAGQASDDDIHSTYDQVAHTVPQGTLADGISHTFRSDQTPPFDQMLSGLFGRSNPNQKAGLLNQILATLGPSAGSLLRQAGLGGLATSAPEAGPVQVTPQQAEQVSPQDVQVLAKQAERKDPTIVDQAASFYAQHPTLVKAIGAGALALLLSRMSRR